MNHWYISHIKKSLLSLTGLDFIKLNLFFFRVGSVSSIILTMLRLSAIRVTLIKTTLHALNMSYKYLIKLVIGMPHTGFYSGIILRIFDMKA